MNQLTVIIPSNESLSVVEEFLPGICRASSNSRSVTILLIDSCFKTDVKEFCESLSVEYASADKACRSAQLNYGARQSIGDALFFVHLDSILPSNYDVLIQEAFRKGADSGCFRMKFNPSTTFLNFWSYFSRFCWGISRGGDQGLFVKRNIFNEMGGYEDWPIMEDVKICYELKRAGAFSVIKGPIFTSSRKYEKYGQVYLQGVFVLLTSLYWLGIQPKRLREIYNRFLDKV